jgi:hypothetical protein
MRFLRIFYFSARASLVALAIFSFFVKITLFFGQVVIVLLRTGPELVILRPVELAAPNLAVEAASPAPPSNWIKPWWAADPAAFGILVPWLWLIGGWVAVGVVWRWAGRRRRQEAAFPVTPDARPPTLEP